MFDEDGGGTIDLDEVIKIVIGLYNMNGEQVSASKSSIRRFVITEKAIRHYANQPARPL